MPRCERGCQGKKILPAPQEDAGVVTYIQPRLILIRGVVGLAALALERSPESREMGRMQGVVERAPCEYGAIMS